MGQRSNAPNRIVTSLKVIATVLVYNEADIVGQALEHPRRRDISFVVPDGGPEDGSIEIVQAFRDNRPLEHRSRGVVSSIIGKILVP
jgi:hypothetical protein